LKYSFFEVLLLLFTGIESGAYLAGKIICSVPQIFSATVIPRQYSSVFCFGFLFPPAVFENRFFLFPTGTLRYFCKKIKTMLKKHKYLVINSFNLL
jgi:hypothetical protein